jgi:hypothetical protein
MMIRKLGLSFVMLATLLLTAHRASALGEILGQSKEELKLKYDVVVHDPENGIVMVQFILADEGRMKPLDAVELMMPMTNGSGSYDLVAPLSLREIDGKRQVTVQLKKEWASRAEIWLNTNWFDGKKLVMTHYHHIIPVAKYLAKPAAATQSPATSCALPPTPVPAAPPATEGKKE